MRFFGSSQPKPQSDPPPTAVSLSIWRKLWLGGWFWLIFGALNALLFVPLFYFFAAETTLWPTDMAATWQAILYDRPNLDPWRLHLEFTALVAIWVWRRPRPRKRFTLLFAGLYLFTLVYTLYEGFVRSYYLLDPIWYNDFPLFRDGALYVLHSLHLAPIIYFLALAALAGLAALVALLVHILLKASTQIGSQRFTRWVLLALLLWATAVLLAKGPAMSEPSTAVASLTSKLAHNASLSQEAWQASRQFTRDRLTPFYELNKADLATKPNIYLIFVESYGSVLYQRPDFRRNYQTLTSQLNDDLTADGWHVVSSRSESPTWGGGSWIAYTSAISGLPITAHAQYLLLLNQYQTQTLPSLPNYLRQQGYKSYSISGNADVLPEIEWQRYKLFYGIDQWWRVDEMGYTGPLYGWGPSLPDQYAFGYAQEQMRQQGEPHFLFYVTQNSHYPWHPLPPVTANWQELAALPAPALNTERVPHAVLRQRYWRSIERQLQGLLGEVQTHGRDNDLYILIGDHQPARVANYGDGWDTPIHIITQDPALAEAFLPFGFVPGFDTEALTPAPLHHAGLYSLLSHVLLAQYGADPTTAPPYLPFGTQQK